MPAHRQVLDEQSPTKRKQYIMPSLSGKYGIAFLIRGKQLFIGIELDDVEIERVVRRKLVKTPKRSVRVLRYDPNL